MCQAETLSLSCSQGPRGQGELVNVGFGTGFPKGQCGMHPKVCDALGSPGSLRHTFGRAARRGPPDVTLRPG